MSTQHPIQHTAQEVPALDLLKAYTMHQGDNKVTTYDQSGFLYDGLTLMPLHGDTKGLEEKYCIPPGAPFSRQKTTQEKITEAVNTIRASGAVDADTLSKFDKMFRNMLVEQDTTEAKGGGSSSSTSKPKEK